MQTKGTLKSRYEDVHRRIAEAASRIGRRAEEIVLVAVTKFASIDEIREHNYALTPGRYVGAEAQEDDGEPFDVKMKRLSAQLNQQIADGRKLDSIIEAKLRELGYGC
jgi:type I restriction enzyme M protein